MTINQSDLEELKQIYFKHYAVNLTDDQILELGTKLIELFKVIARSVPKTDRIKVVVENG